MQMSFLSTVCSPDLVGLSIYKYGKTDLDSRVSQLKKEMDSKCAFSFMEICTIILGSVPQTVLEPRGMQGSNWSGVTVHHNCQLDGIKDQETP